MHVCRLLRLLMLKFICSNFNFSNDLQSISEISHGQPVCLLGECFTHTTSYLLCLKLILFKIPSTADTGVKYVYLLPFPVLFDIFYALITRHLASASS